MVLMLMKGRREETSKRRDDGFVYTRYERRHGGSLPAAWLWSRRVGATKFAAVSMFSRPDGGGTVRPRLPSAS